MIDRRALLGAYEEFAEALLHPYEIGEVLYRLTDRVVEVLEVDAAAVLLARDGQDLSLVAASDRRVAAIEDQQRAMGSGPSHDAFRDNRQVRLADVRDDCPWTGLCEVVLEQGMQAVAGLPMPVGDRRIGAVGLYRSRPGPWSDEEIRVAQMLANMASGYILNNLELSEAKSEAEQLQTALDSRVVVEQAKGVVAGRHRIAPNDAFARLRDHAIEVDEPLHVVCHRVVEGSLDL